MFEEDETKRRRNLVAFAGLVLLGALYGVEIQDVISKVTGAEKTARPLLSFVVGMSINAYLVFRYATRPRTEEGDAKGSDIEMFRAERRRISGLFARWRVNLWMKREIYRGGLFIASKSPFRDDPLSRFRSGGELAGTAVSASTSDAPPVIGSPSDQQMTIAFNVSYMGAKAGELITYSGAATLNPDYFAKRWLHWLSFARTAIGTQMAIDRLLPYYLAAAAMVAAAYRLWSACGASAS